jgi:hypothetical protein
MLIQGVLPGEDPRLTTLWTILGWQPVTLVTPVWVRSADCLPDMLQAVPGESAPLNAMTLTLKAACFPIQRGNGPDYLQVSRLTNQAGNGFLDKVLPAETEIIRRAVELQTKWRRKKIRDRDLKKFNRWLESYAHDFYQREFQQEF